MDKTYRIKAPVECADCGAEYIYDPKHSTTCPKCGSKKRIYT